MSSSTSFDLFDYGVLSLMLVMSTCVGCYFGFCGPKIKSVAEFVNGSGKLKTIPVAISLIASQITSVLIISVPGEIYVHGAIYALTVCSMILAVCVINHLILPVFFENNISNCYEYLELRFDKKLKAFQTLQFIIGVLLLLPVTLYLPALVFAEVTGTSVHLVNAILSAVCVFYTMIGGVKAVVWTDVVQAIVMISSSFVVVTIGIKNVGNFWYVIHLAIEGGRFDLFDTTFDLSTRHTVWNILIGYTIVMISYTAFNPSSMNRIMSLPTIKQAKKALSIFAIGNFVIVLLNCLTGLVIYAKYFKCDPLLSQELQKADQLVPFFIRAVISPFPGLTGLFVACVFSAGLSTMSANLNSLAGVLYEDCVKPKINHTEGRANLVMRLIIVLFGIYCFLMGFVMQSIGSILQLVLVVFSVSNGTTLGIYFLGMFWPKANRTGGFWGAVASWVTVVGLVFYSRISMFKAGVKLPTLETTIEKCDNLDELLANNVTMTLSELYEDDSEDSEKPFYLNIAVPWFPVMGFAIVWLLGIVISHLTQHSDPPKYKSTLVSKLCRKYVPTEILEIEMKVLEEPAEKKNLLVH